MALSCCGMNLLIRFRAMYAEISFCSIIRAVLSSVSYFYLSYVVTLAVHQPLYIHFVVNTYHIPQIAMSGVKQSAVLQSVLEQPLSPYWTQAQMLPYFRRRTPIQKTLSSLSQKTRISSQRYGIQYVASEFMTLSARLNTKHRTTLDCYYPLLRLPCFSCSSQKPA